MGGWQRRWLLGSLLAVAGCTSAPETGTATEAPGPARPTTSPEALECTPRASQDAAIPPLPDGEEPPSLAPAACVPCNQAPPQHEARACEVLSWTPQQTERLRYDETGVLRELLRTRANGKPMAHQLYDADGHLLEDQQWSSGGLLPGEGPSRLETYVWADGLLRQSAWTELPAQLWTREDWTYDSQHRPVTRTLRQGTASDSSPTVYQYIYDTERLQRVERHVLGELADLIEYQYDATGRLVRTVSNLGDGSDPRLLELRTYDDAGWLSGLSRKTGVDDSIHETYDALGRLLTTSWMGWEDSDYTARVYDDTGHLSRYDYGYAGMGRQRHMTRRYLRDARGETALEWSVDWTRPFMGDKTFTRQTIRSTHLCSSSLLFLTETDEDGDGGVDSSCAYSRDPQGRLLSIQCAPLAQPHAVTSRVEYHYDCSP